MLRMRKLFSVPVLLMQVKWSHPWMRYRVLCMCECVYACVCVCVCVCVCMLQGIVLIRELSAYSVVPKCSYVKDFSAACELLRNLSYIPDYEGHGYLYSHICK